MAQDPDSTFGEAIGELADELLRVGATLSHAQRQPRATTAAVDPIALRRLLCGALELALTGHTVIEILDAAGILSCATDALPRIAGHDGPGRRTPVVQALDDPDP